MSTVLGAGGYGKRGIRLVKVTRRPDHHELRDVTVDVQVGGDLRPLYEDGDNTGALATDSMRNAVYALARRHPLTDPEPFALALVDHFLRAPRVGQVRVDLTERRWRRLDAGGGPHPHAFGRAGGGVRTASVSGSGDRRRVRAGVSELPVLRTTGSGWAGFLRDEFTTLPDTDDRILATVVSATWTYHEDLDGLWDLDFGRCWEHARERLLSAFADHRSPSLQHTLYRMGGAVLDALDDVERVQLTLPNQHHLLVDLAPFGLDNPGEVFVAADQPHGLISGTVVRDGHPPAGGAAAAARSPRR
jgi:urate oxidase